MKQLLELDQTLFPHPKHRKKWSEHEISSQGHTERGYPFGKWVLLGMQKYLKA